MIKGNNGFGLAGFIVILLTVGVGALTGWRITNYQDRDNSAVVSQPRTSEEINSNTDNQSNKNNQNNPPIDYPKPSAPTNLRVTPKDTGYSLSWGESVSAAPIVNYRVYYQNNLLAEPETTNYQHNLPPPPPGCNPITLTYFVTAVDGGGQTSDPSNYVSVEFGGC